MKSLFSHVQGLLLGVKTLGVFGTRPLSSHGPVQGCNLAIGCHTACVSVHSAIGASLMCRGIYWVSKGPSWSLLLK